MAVVPAMGHLREGAAILELTPDGRLPVGRHSADIEEIHDLFVKRAPHAEARQLIFDAFKIHCSLVQRLFKHGKLWVDGGFCTHKEEAPKDIDMVIIVDPGDLQDFGPAEEERLLQLLTLQGVEVSSPGARAPRVQPMGGLIDCFFILTIDVDALDMWDQLWSSVKGSDGAIMPGVAKGYLEMSW
ncbi:hypothetical protein PUR59_01600 [Streptomyces sp. SP18ES09]|uniref:DUF6932 family protein n=1 Tax=Streptomyces sp. SP18ES09 TaxID=3002532 RepID=UPI002E7A9150|nr:hypothetical protein [Streptomyces sp. SP18ES09]MEE1813736.1 hypothetical protein [Streptomyces sp. SP18ES09]